MAAKRPVRELAWAIYVEDQSLLLAGIGIHIATEGCKFPPSGKSFGLVNFNLDASTGIRIFIDFQKILMIVSSNDSDADKT